MCGLLLALCMKFSNCLLPTTVFGQTVIIILVLQTVQALTLLNQNNQVLFSYYKRNLVW